MKAFVDDKIIVAQKLEFVSGTVENIVRKGENACYYHFLLFPNIQNISFSGLLNSGIVW